MVKKMSFLHTKHYSSPSTLANFLPMISFKLDQLLKSRLPSFLPPFIVIDDGSLNGTDACVNESLKVILVQDALLA
jgi:hypothetical protein